MSNSLYTILVRFGIINAPPLDPLLPWLRRLGTGMIYYIMLVRCQMLDVKTGIISSQ